MDIAKTIRNYIAEHPNCNFSDIATKAGLPSTTPANQIWRHLRELADEDGVSYNIILIEGEEGKETFRLRPGTACYIECVQDITIQCYQKMYADMDEPDHAQLLQDIRIWAQEFEDWWWNLPESHRDDIGYWDAIDKYCDRLLKGNHAGITRESNLQEFTAIAVEHNILSDKLMGEKNLSREDAFAQIRSWADKFWEEYKDINVFEDIREGISYYDRVDAFIKKQISWN